MISPITPPFELMNQWYKKACKDPYNGGKFIMAPVLKEIATAAAQWGADPGLDACWGWVRGWYGSGCGELINGLRAARRPKPPSLKEQALEALNQMDEPLGVVTARRASIIRRALEALPND